MSIKPPSKSEYNDFLNDICEISKSGISYKCFKTDDHEIALQPNEAEDCLEERLKYIFGSGSYTKKRDGVTGASYFCIKEKVVHDKAKGALLAKQNPLIQALQWKCSTLFKELFKERIYQNKQDSEGRSALHYIAQADDIDLGAARLILSDPTVRIDAEDKWGRTPFWYACEARNKELVRLLIEEDTNRNLDLFQAPLSEKQDVFGNTPLHSLAQSSRGTSNDVQGILKEFLSAFPHMNWNKKNKDGETALMLACKHSSPEVVKMFLAIQDVDSKAQTDKGISTLHYAWKLPNRQAVELILKSGRVNLNAEFVNAWSKFYHPLVEDLELTQLILGLGVDVNSVDTQSGETLLHRLANWPQSDKRALDLARSLLQNEKTNIHAKDKNGDTPLQIACKTGNQPMVDLLLTSGRMRPEHVMTQDYVHHNGQNMLMYAARQCHNCHTEIFHRFLTSYKWSFKATDKDNQNVLHKAAQAGSVDIVKDILTHSDVYLNTPDKSGITPFMKAVLSGKKEVVELLVKTLWIHPEDRDSNGNTALHHACMRKDTAMVELLLKTGKADPDAKNKKGETAYSFCLENGLTDILHKFLVTNTINTKHLSKTKDKEDRNILHHAVSAGNIDLVRELLAQSDVKLNTRDKSGRLPFIEAVRLGKKEIVELLIKSSWLDYWDHDNDYNTPLLHACMRKDIEMVELLLSSEKTKLFACNTKKQTVLSFCLSNGLTDIFLKIVATGANSTKLLHASIRNSEINDLKELLKYKEVEVDVNAPDKDGKTPLMVAIEQTEEEGLDKEYFFHLLSHEKINVNAVDNEGKTALHLAVDAEFVEKEYIYALIERMSPQAIAHVAKDGRNVLMLAAQYTSDEIFDKILHCYKWDFTAKCNDGNTPLHFAAKNSRTDDVIEKLLSYDKSTIDIQNKEGQTPLLLASMKKYEEATKLLLDAGASNINAKDSKTGNTALTYWLESEDEESTEESTEIAKRILQMPDLDILATDIDKNTYLHYLALVPDDELLPELMKNEKFQLILNEVNDKGQTPLMIACREKDNDTAKLLLERGATINAKEKETGDTVLAHCLKNNLLDLAKRIVQMPDLDIFATDKNKNTYLHLLARSGNYELFLELMKKEEFRFILNEVNNDGDTAIHLLSKNGSSDKEADFVRILCTIANVNINVKNKQGKTAIMCALENGRLLISKTLFGQKADLEAIAPDGTSVFTIACGYGMQFMCTTFSSPEEEYFRNYLQSPNRVQELYTQGKDLNTPIHLLSSINLLNMDLIALSFITRNVESLRFDTFRVTKNAQLQTPLEIISGLGGMFAYIPYAIFKQIPALGEQLNPQNFQSVSYFIEHPEKLVNDPRNPENFNPMELALLVNNMALTRSLAKCMGKERFEAYITKLRAKYPNNVVDEFAFNASYQINTAHFKKGKLSQPMPPKPAGRTVDDLKKVLQGAPFNWKKKNDNTRELDSFLQKFRTQKLEGLNPGHYPIIEQAICLTVEYLLKSPPSKIINNKKCTFINDLLYDVAQCGPKAFLGATRLYYKIVLDVDDTFQECTYGAFGTLRSNMFDTAVPSGPQSMHAYSQCAKKYAEKYGIFGAKTASTFRDPFAHVAGGDASGDLTEFQFQSFETLFLKFYTPFALLQEFLELAKYDAGFIRKYHEFWLAHPIYKKEEYGVLFQKIASWKAQGKAQKEVEELLTKEPLAEGIAIEEVNVFRQAVELFLKSASQSKKEEIEANIFRIDVQKALSKTKKSKQDQDALLQEFDKMQFAKLTPEKINGHLLKHNLFPRRLSCPEEVKAYLTQKEATLDTETAHFLLLEKELHEKQANENLYDIVVEETASGQKQKEMGAIKALEQLEIITSIF